MAKKGSMRKGPTWGDGDNGSGSKKSGGTKVGQMGQSHKDWNPGSLKTPSKTYKGK